MKKIKKKLIDLLTPKITRDNLNRLIAHHQTDERTLEVGSHGNPSYGQFFPNRVGIDIREGKGVDIVASVYDLPFADQEFDCVLCLSVLEHLERPPQAIKEMQRVLKVGKKIIVSVPFLFPIHEAPHDYWRFTKFGLQQLFTQDWQIEELRSQEGPQATFAILIQRLALQTRLRFLDKTLRGLLFILAKLINSLPRLIKIVFGDNRKDRVEPEAFASAFFLVARRVK